MNEKRRQLGRKATMTLTGRVEKVLPSSYSGTPGRVQITVEGADDLYGQLRVKNIFRNEKGEELALVPEADVEIVITAHAKFTTPVQKPAN